MSAIVNNEPLINTCGVCGSPLNPISKVLPDFLNEFSTKCNKCNKAVCNEHFDRSSNCCTNCKHKSSGWCGTIGIA